MKTLSLIAAGLGLAVAAVPTVASAAPAWQSVNARQTTIERRIDVGVRNGSLNRNEAYRLRSELRQIVNLENRYRVGGLNMRERADLDRRFNALSAKIRVDRYDRHDRNRRWG